MSKSPPMSFTRFPRLSKLLAAASLAALCGLPAAAHACGETVGNPNSTCGGDQPAAKSTGLPGTQASNPIDIVTGNKYQHETDFAPLPGTLGLQWGRHYNSRSEHQGALGIGWSHAYEAALYRGEDAVIQIRQADGRLIFFRRGKDPIFRPVLPGDGQVEIIGDQYRWSWRDGRKLTFNLDGRLTAIQTRTGEAVFLTYDRHGRLIGLTDPQKRALSFAYDDTASPEQRRFIKSVTGSFGRIGYEYDGWNNLVKAIYPDGTSRRYLYDDDYDAHNLTGIIDRSGQRYGTYAYDGNDRAILSTHANGVEKVTLQFERPAPRDGSATGRTVLTNSLGHRTVYETRILNRVPVILEAHGPGCSTCGKTNVRYGYSKSGQLESETSLDQKGQPIQTTQAEYDVLGRPVKLARQTYTHGKPARPVLLQRFEYQGDNPNPSLIAAPSVVPGKERQIRIEYGATEASRFQPAKVTETGYSPLGAEGKPDPAKPTPITRATSYGYDGKGRVAAIDGPLANGPRAEPGDSDITRYEYDAHTGLIARIVGPGGSALRVLERDAAGRATRVESGDGVSAHTTTVAYNERGQPVEQSVAAGGLKRTTRYAYDAGGQLIRVKRADGVELAAERDAAGRLAALKDAHGNRQALVSDTEGRPVAVYTQDARGKVLNGLLNLWDADNHLVGQLTPQHLAQLNAYDLGDPDRLVATMDAAGHLTAYDQGVRGNERIRTAPDGGATRIAHYRDATLIEDENARLHVLARDDFGRPAAQADPDVGVTWYAYDAADNPLRIVAAGRGGESKARSVEYRYDVAGRLLEKKTAECTETYRYQGERLARREGCGQAQSYVYNALGELIEDVQEIDGKRFTTRYAWHPETGRLEHQTLPGGETLSYRYDANLGRLSHVEKEGKWLVLIRQYLPESAARRLAGWLPRSWLAEPLLTGIVYQPFGARTGYTHGNGARAEFVYDTSGNATAVSVSAAGVTLLDQSNDYNARGDLVARTLEGRSERYRYDAVGRLTAVEAGARPLKTAQTAAPPATQAWRYDRMGNRLAEARPEQAAGETRTPWGEITALGAQKLEYDSQGRLTKLYQDGKLKAEYRYDGEGRRLAKTVHFPGKRTTYYLYDPQNRLVAEADESGRISAEYLYLGTAPYAKLENGETYAIHTDHLGTPHKATDKNRNIVWEADYQAFGRARVKGARTQTANLGLISAAHAANDSRFELNLRFPGQYHDAESGLHYNVYRYYDPEQGRYLTPDPLGLAEGTNRYAYVGNRPLTASDPWGLFKVETLISDPIHEEIVRVAFGRFHAAWREDVLHNETSKEIFFSEDIINQFIYWNRQTDLRSENQFDYRNHFDNPVDGPPQGGDAYWIKDSLQRVNERRGNYGNWTSTGGKTDLRDIVKNFGMNTHTLADFYAHTNWVDAAARGGDYVQRAYEPSQPSGMRVLESGCVPHGADHPDKVWDEQTFDGLYSGNAEGCATMACAVAAFKNPFMVYHHNVFDGKDSYGNDDKTTHAYWAKDEPGEPRHAEARELAVQHTVKEIWRLYDQIKGTDIAPYFKLNAQQLDQLGILYKGDDY